MPRFKNDKTNFKTIQLIQNFIYVKLGYFLQKHMKMSNIEILNPNRIYSFTSSYTDIVTIFAFRQAFTLDYRFIKEELSGKFYNDALIWELEDIGILKVLKSITNEFYLRFNHETYQEYFAALFIFKTIISSDKKIAEQTIKKHRYNPKFHLIIMLACQLFLKGDPLLPAYSLWNNSNQELNEKIVIFLKTIIEEGDYLGAASARLLKKCLEDHILDEKLMNIFKDRIKILGDLLDLNKSYGRKISSFTKHEEFIPIMHSQCSTAIILNLNLSLKIP